jgi:hypothetical protein
MSRLVLTPSDARSADGFQKIVINHIVDRIWFVEGAFGDHSYAPPSGATYGDTIAEGETKLVLETLVGYAQSHPDLISTIPTDLTGPDVNNLIDQMFGRRLHATAIVASISNGLRFWEFNGFIFADNRRGLASPDGHFFGVPIYHTRLFTPRMTLVVNRDELGILEIKSDFDITLSDLDDAQERRVIRDQIPKFSDEDLQEKVQVICQLVVKPIIRERSTALQLMLTQGTKPEIKVPVP